MSRTRIEQETCVTFNAEQDFALVGTCNPTTLRRMTKLNPEIHRKDGEWTTYECRKAG